MTNKLGSANPNRIPKPKSAFDKSDWNKDFVGETTIIKNGKKVINPKYEQWLTARVEEDIKNRYDEVDWFAYKTLKLVESTLKGLIDIGDRNKIEKEMLQNLIRYAHTSQSAYYFKYQKHFKLLDTTYSKRGKPTYLVSINKKEYLLNQTQWNIIEHCMKYYGVTPFKFNEDVADALGLGAEYLSEYFKNRDDDFFEEMFVRVKGKTDYYHLNLPNWR